MKKGEITLILHMQRDLEEDLLKSSNLCKQNCNWTQDIHDSSILENTKMKIEDTNNIIMNLSSALMQDSNLDNTEGFRENNQIVSRYSIVERYYTCKYYSKIELNFIMT